MVIVDTSVWIDFLRNAVNPHAQWLERSVFHQEIGLTSLILCEILQGARTDARFHAFRRDLSRFPIFDSGSTSLAIAAARNYRILREKGFTTRKTGDCLIATLCIESGYQLLHNDRDFTPFEMHLGLNVLHPPALPLN